MHFKVRPNVEPIVDEDEFWKYVSDWPSMNTDQETFSREWDYLGKEIWMNIDLREKEISNGALSEILQENFLIKCLFPNKISTCDSKFLY